jgi:hypothetical protein
LLIRLNRFEESKEVINDIIKLKLDRPSTHDNLYQIAFIQADERLMQEQIAWLTRKVTKLRRSIGKRKPRPLTANYARLRSFTTAQSSLPNNAT